ncbi:U-scoloptoxin(19)-Tl1a [Panulirus ornatus]|uniref:U-scoloptoxin(19)-Tl1a n=1 Tax=Panulirus ornatus TaxID=150431 RepID=UPI003A85B2AD
MRLHVRALLVLVAGVALVQATVEIPGDGLEDVDTPVQFRPEDDCSREGGLCGLESACPLEARHPSKGLCPTQQYLGAECCYAVPDNVLNCRQRGGECLPTSACGRAPRDLKGQCSQGEVCCILV